jgi:hypothetical protein
MALLQNTWHNCKTNCKTAKKCTTAKHGKTWHVSSLLKLPAGSPCHCIADALIHFESPATTQQPNTAQQQQNMANMAKHGMFSHSKSCLPSPPAVALLMMPLLQVSCYYTTTSHCS